MTEHSPYPWGTAAGDTPDSIKIVAADGMTVCTFRNANNPDDTEQQANVRLVTAAPKLLDFVERVACGYAVSLPESRALVQEVRT